MARRRWVYQNDAKRKKAKGLLLQGPLGMHYRNKRGGMTRAMNGVAIDRKLKYSGYLDLREDQTR